MAMIVMGRDVWAECISYSHLLYGQSVLATRESVLASTLTSCSVLATPLTSCMGRVY